MDACFFRCLKRCESKDVILDMRDRFTVVRIITVSERHAEQSSQLLTSTRACGAESGTIVTGLALLPSRTWALFVASTDVSPRSSLMSKTGAPSLMLETAIGSSFLALRRDPSPSALETGLSLFEW